MEPFPSGKRWRMRVEIAHRGYRITRPPPAAKLPVRMGSHLLGWLAVACYAARGGRGDRLAGAARASALARAVPALVAAGLALHFARPARTARASSRSVPYRTLGGSVSFFGWMLGIAYLVLLLCGTASGRSDRS